MRPQSRNDFAIAIICALTLEADAVEALFDETYDRLGRFYKKQPGDANWYINGRIGEHNVVLCYLPGMGKRGAASVASSLRVSYTKIQLALVVGICGGAPMPSRDEEIFLGDVIISDTVIEYDFGRQYPGGYRRKTGVKETLGRPDREIRTLLNGLKADYSRPELQRQTLHYLNMLQGKEDAERPNRDKWLHPGIDDVLFRVGYLHQHRGKPVPCGCYSSQSSSSDEICEGALQLKCGDLGCDKTQVIRRRQVSDHASASVHIGTIGSADTVMKSGQHRDEIMRTEKVIGFEMEGAGVWDNLPCIIIKGVCDYADSHKSTSWQAYAAATGASAAKAFLEYWPSYREDPTKKAHVMIPFRRNHRFVGRQQELQNAERLMSMPNGQRKLAIFGLGGVGKTQVALELAYRMQDRDAECSIFWIPCTSHEAVQQACIEIAEMVGIQITEPAEAKGGIKTYLTQQKGKWLLIFDNADEMNMWDKGSNTTTPLKDFLPYTDQGQIIFTTRNRKVAVQLASSDVIHVRELDENAGLEFLENSLIRKSLLNDSNAAITFLEQLTFLPLAIAQATAYINENDLMAFSIYLRLLQKQEAEAVQLLSRDFGDDGRYEGIQNPIAKTWLISFHQVQKLDPRAAEYLSLMACVDSRNIPRSLLPQPTSELEMIESLGLLSAYSFITIQPENDLITLHRLVHLATRNWLKKESQFPFYVTRAAERLDEVFPHNDHVNRQIWREYLPHALFLLNESEFQRQEGKYTDYIRRVGTCLERDGRYNEAERLFVQVIETWKQVLGPEHPNTLINMGNLALTYLNQGRWKEAEELEVQAIKTWKQVLGLKHYNTLASMTCLALIYWYQGRWKEAEKLNMQVIKISKQVLGPEHPNTLTSMGNLALSYKSQGRWKEAEELEVQLMGTRKQVLGPEHPSTLISMGNLASTYLNQGRWKEAEKLNVQVIEISKQMLGPEHPDTLNSLGYLALSYKSQGRWKEAEELEVPLMETWKQMLGLEHPNTLTSMSCLASTYLGQKRWKEAEELQIQVTEVSKQVLGPEHPNTLTSMHNFACTLRFRDDTQAAIALMDKCVELRYKVLGPEHADYVSSSDALRTWKAEIPVRGAKRQAFINFFRKR
ncbi:uncharacterized protein LDX57_007331 [Aspergillus melleus]|uniref:uncharacterized protein n=1 Tax=Aspergillus melleus TaxID=138277 RepID=UPI001E8DB7EF|nr:uncharacterized protein LDX57_007331 [Aspergillus melleus]KAH8429659.1 hypothetical protein LDX57_007331 [Aspergillus melleus]